MRMLGKKTQVCRIGRCDCANAHDSRGKKYEKRLAKHRENAKLREVLARDDETV